MHEPSSPPAPRPYESLIGIRDLADWLDVSPHTVKKWVSRGPESGRVPRMIRVNGVTEFRPEDVRTWIAGRAVGG